MKQLSCGILNYYKENNEIYVLLASSGGPYFINKECWSIPKGLYEDNEDEMKTAIREFKEETNISFNTEKLVFLDKVSQSSKKDVSCFLLEGKLDLKDFKSNTFKMEYPPNSGIIDSYPEIKEIKYFNIKEAKEKIIKGQIVLLEKLESLGK